MRDRIEVLRKIGIDHRGGGVRDKWWPVTAGEPFGLTHAQPFADRLHGLVGVASGPEAE